MNYYKATRPNGRDFMTGTIDYAAALASGEVIHHPSKRKTRDAPSTYLSVSIEPADCTGFHWPCRLFRVEPVGRVMANLSVSPNKRAVSALRVVEELPAHLALGPNGEQVAAFIERCHEMTKDDAKKLDTAWYVARDTAMDTAWSTTRNTARDAAWVAAQYATRYAARDTAMDTAWSATRDTAMVRGVWYAARDAALAMVARDRITPGQYATLVKPFVDAGLGEWVA